MSADSHGISEAYHSARKSKDPSTQVGAAIIGPDREARSTGYNGPCRGEDDSDTSLFERPLKYAIFEHAERNAIYNAARIGVSCRGCTMYVTFPPCVDCARAIVQSGIARLVLHRDSPNSERWAESQQTAMDLLQRCGVQVDWWSGPPDFIDKVRFNGQWHEFRSPAA